MDVVYIVGPPASGKSTLMRELTSGLQRVERIGPVPHQALIDPRSGFTRAIEIGKNRDDFPGTDTLAMNIAPAAKAWIATTPHALVLGEGDRLGFPGFLQACLDASAMVTVVHLMCLPEELDRRCELRGSAQNATWRGGRATKALNLAAWARERPGCRVVTLDTTATRPAGLVAGLLEVVSVLRTLKRNRTEAVINTHQNGRTVVWDADLPEGRLRVEQDEQAVWSHDDLDTPKGYTPTLRVTWLNGEIIVDPGRARELCDKAGIDYRMERKP